MLGLTPVSLGYDRGSWERDILKKFFNQLPGFTIDRIRHGLKRIEPGREHTGQAHYDKGKRLITVSQGNLHPKYFLEVVCHEIGHALTEFPPPDVNAPKDEDESADGFGLLLFYPELIDTLLREDVAWRIIREFHVMHTFNANVPSIKINRFAEPFVEKVFKGISNLTDQKTKTAMQRIFEHQHKGFFWKYAE
ncbi:hypothetical protein HYU13_06125 [Candidatus Woesearchaeota archaeon]|nr:hypothetical protein [Candidatus Woesearchaeota archaeon]